MKLIRLKSCVPEPGTIQKENFAPSCVIRESFTADVTTPNVELPSVVPGLLKCGVFVRLNHSARSSSEARFAKPELPEE